MGAAIELGVHCRHDLGMAMAEQHRAVPAEIIDVAAPVDVPLARPLGVVDVEAIGLDIAGIVCDAARKQGGRRRGARRRSGRSGAIGGDDRRVRRQAVGHIGLRLQSATFGGPPLARATRLAVKCPQGVATWQTTTKTSYAPASDSIWPSAARSRRMPGYGRC